MYRKNKEKINLGKSGSGAGDVTLAREIAWPHFLAMKFLDESHITRKTFSSLLATPRIEGGDNRIAGGNGRIEGGNDRIEGGDGRIEGGHDRTEGDDDDEDFNSACGSMHDLQASQIGIQILHLTPITIVCLHI
jgi:hypothetical protein